MLTYRSTIVTTREDLSFGCFTHPKGTYLMISDDQNMVFNGPFIRVIDCNGLSLIVGLDKIELTR